MIFTIVIILIVCIEISNYIRFENKEKKIVQKNIEIKKITLNDLDSFKMKNISESQIIDFKPGYIYTEEESNSFIEIEKDILLIRKNTLYKLNLDFKIDFNIINFKEKFQFYYKPVN